MAYLLDTSTCVHYLRGRSAVLSKMQTVGWSKLYISEITIIELLYGVERGGRPEKEAAVVSFINRLQVVPIRATYKYLLLKKRV